MLIKCVIKWVFGKKKKPKTLEFIGFFLSKTTKVDTMKRGREGVLKFTCSRDIGERIGNCVNLCCQIK